MVAEKGSGRSMKGSGPDDAWEVQDLRVERGVGRRALAVDVPPADARARKTGSPIPSQPARIAAGGERKVVCVFFRIVCLHVH